MRQRFGLDLRLDGWSDDVLPSIWQPDELGWDTILARTYPEATLDLAVWLDQRLLCLALLRSHGIYLVLDKVEADPDPSAPLRGLRVPIVLDTAVQYAQMLGKQKILVHPKTAALVNYYVQVCGFKQEDDFGHLSLAVD